MPWPVVSNARTGDIIVMIDADGSTDPEEIPRFVAALRDGADFAKGTRFKHGGGSLDITFCGELGNMVLNTTVNLLFWTRSPTSATATTHSGAATSR